MNFQGLLCIGMLALSGLVGGCSNQNAVARLPRPADPMLAPAVRARTLIFVKNDCPIANRYSPDIRRLHDTYAPRGIAFWLVHSDPDENAQDVRRHDREYQLNLPTLLDHRQVFARLAKASVVPSVSVFAPDGGLIYHGRIDDRFAELGLERPQPTRHDLEDVLDAVLARRPVQIRATRAVGCYIFNRP